MKVHHSRTQHPVGQGGFHSAILEAGDARFRYVYDCGSMNIDALVRSIDDFAQCAERVDILFLSHLDQDHINGVDRLLEHVAVDDVVLPYLSPFERLVLLAEALARPSGTTSAMSLMEFLSAPAAWLSRRGVGRVVFVGRGDASPEPVLLPNAPEQVEDPAADAQFSSDFGSMLTSPRKGDDKAKGSVEMKPGPILVRRSGHPVWALIPFVHPEPARMDAFKSSVARVLRFRRIPELSDQKWMSGLRGTIAEPKARGELARCYTEHIRGDRNLTSMSLYSGPVSAAKVAVANGSVDPWRRWYLGRDSSMVGWLGTGDAHLDVAKRCKALESFYANCLPATGTVMLPHHGSRRNVGHGFIQSLPARIWVAAYGRDNSYQHPDEHVIRLADEYGKAVHVTERRKTKLIESFALEWK